MSRISFAQRRLSTMKPRSIFFLITLFLLTLLHPHPTHAHNGAVAIAVPIEGIMVDGDLSDWPEGMKEYPIERCEYGDKPVDEEDFQGSFRIGYNEQENALYVAVEVQDESTVIDTTAEAAWDTQDGCEVYVDVEHGEKDSPAVQYVIFGNTLRGGNYKVEVKREEKVHWYEWQIDIGGMSQGQVHLHSGMTLGVDIVVCDKDDDGSFSWMAWGRGTTSKVSSTDRLGDVMLVEEDVGLGKIQGTVRWEDVEEGIAHAKVQFQSLTSDIALMGKTDREGAYAVELPAGRYRVSVAELGRGERERIPAEVKEGSEEEVALVIHASRGQVVPAGPGKGHWQTFGIPEGLSSPVITAIVEDREGHLWFGTGGGVSRYDGTTFTTYTTEDGLAANVVQSILEDQQGHLWFGTGGGVSRYDGETFATYTTEEGLAHNEVLSIVA